MEITQVAPDELAQILDDNRLGRTPDSVDVMKYDANGPAKLAEPITPQFMAVAPLTPDLAPNTAPQITV